VACRDVADVLNAKLLVDVTVSQRGVTQAL